MLGRLIESQQRMIDAIAQCVEQVRRNPTVKSLAQEALGEAKGHLDSLQEATAELADNHRASS